jgi:hypothetical protein
MADPLTTSPLDAMADLYTNPAPMPGQAGAPMQPMPQPAGQPVLPPNFELPHNPNFERELVAARGPQQGAAQPGQPAAPAKPAAAPAQAEPAAQPSAEDAFSWKPGDRKRSKDWDNLKADFSKREAGLQAKIAELEAKVGGQPGQPASEFDIAKLEFEKLTKHPEVAKRLKERDEFFDIVKQVAVERDPEFVAKFEPRRDAAIKAAKSVAGGAANDLAKLLSEPPSDVRDERIGKLIENFSDSSKRMVHAAMQNLAVIDLEREGEIATRKASFESKQLDQFKQQEAMARERQQKLDSAFDRQLAYWSDPKDGMPFFMKTGDPKWDAQVDSTVAAARDIFNGTLTPEQLADSAKWAAVAKRIFAEREELLSELQRFREADARWRAGTPSDVGPGGSYVEAARQPATYNPADPFAGSQSFIEGLEAARHADMSRR